MTESTRNPIGPPPRRNAGTPAVQNLIKSNRVAPPPETEAAAAATKPLPSSASKQITFYMAADDLKRAKAAYTATSGQEADRSWSDFISRAVLMEVARRERVHNGGENFPGGIQKLAPGRRLQP
ncbi:ParB family protein [Arthrobacter sp. Soil763]|uniref:ParB family protein n=1 Tax=Arthrobacter sp. Soil763 TaxID=1736402 RepID=UPI00070012C4|nr:hypothetical protein [Arthrobacter sp. Soil763]KRE76600.1 hypothetical protein ASG71_15800 [Arthrobacter sp. Soil763]